MLAIGRALMARPRVLLLDGPSAALALRVVDEVAGAIPVLRAAGLTLLLVEQNVMVGLGLADHVHMLRDGRLAFERTVAEDFTAEGLRDLYLGGRTARPRQAATAACRR
jgi:branched-chain amino acid transport system ATP-binding protein